LHMKMHQFVKDLNYFYKSEPCLWEQDHQRSGFRWINADDANTGIVSFIRYAKKPSDYLIIVCNFTPIGREGYVIGAPDCGEYREVFSSDNSCYGGNGNLHEEPLFTCSDGREGWPYSLMVGVPPLGFICFKKVYKP